LRSLVTVQKILFGIGQRYEYRFQALKGPILMN